MAAFRITNGLVFALCLYICLVRIVPRLGAEFLSRLFGAILSVSFSYLVASRFTGGKIANARGMAVLVTGCDTGIGNALARRLCQLGFRVFAGCLHAEEGPGAAGLRRDCPGRLEVIQLDVTDDQEVSRAVQFVRASLSTTGDVLWGVVNNAGAACWGEAEWVSLDRYKRLAEVNLWGMIRVTKAFLPLIRHCKGRVVNMSSMLGRFSVPSCSAYSITKCGVQAFTDSLRNELANFGVSAVIVEPGNFAGGGSAMFTREYMSADLDRVWSEAPDEVRDVYGTEYFKSTKRNIVNATQGFSPPSLVPVVDACTSALTDENPHQRYFPGNLTSKLAVYGFCFLPSPVTDLFIRLYYKFVVAPVQWGKRKGQS